MSESNGATHARKNRAKWHLLISEWEASGLTQKEFCKKRDLDLNQFRYYKKVLAPPEVLPVKIVADRERKPVAASFTLYLSNEVRLDIPLTCDVQVLQSIFSAARGVRC